MLYLGKIAIRKINKNIVNYLILYCQLIILKLLMYDNYLIFLFNHIMYNIMQTNNLILNYIYFKCFGP